MDGLRGGGSTDEVSGDLDSRMQTSRSWAEWAPGLAAAIVEALRLRHNLEKQEVNEEQPRSKRWMQLHGKTCGDAASTL